MKKAQIIKLVLAGILTAIGVLLPVAFHTFGISGQVFLPMHVPILLCGFICGYRYGLLSGILVPILSSLFTSSPPMFPLAVAMAFELAVYGTATGLFFKRNNSVIVLLGAMILGRVVYAAVMTVLLGINGQAFEYQAFFAGVVTKSLPGVLIQIVLIPLIILALQKAKLLERLS